MLEMIKKINELKAKKEDMYNKYPQACKNPRGRMIYHTYKNLTEEIISLVTKGYELYGEKFLSELKK